MNCTLIILNYQDKIRALNLAMNCKQFSCIDHIVIVDNCSPDGSYEWLVSQSNNEFDIIQSDKNGGFSYGNNFGARYAINKYNSTYILFANTDTIFEELAVKKCLCYLKNNYNIGLISLRMKNINGYEEVACWKEKNYIQFTLFCLWLYRRNAYKKFLYNFTNNETELKYVDVVRGSFMCFKSKVLIDMNFFDEHTFLYYEEDIIAKRLQLLNYKTAIITSEYYVHDHLQNSNIVGYQQKKLLDASMYYLLKKYYNINVFQKIFTSSIIIYSRLEYKMTQFIKRRKKCGNSV